MEFQIGAGVARALTALVKIVEIREPRGFIRFAEVTLGRAIPRNQSRGVKVLRLIGNLLGTIAFQETGMTKSGKKT